MFYLNRGALPTAAGSWKNSSSGWHVERGRSNVPHGSPLHALGTTLFLLGEYIAARMPISRRGSPSPT